MFEGALAVVTVPLGVLKAGGLRFEPGLPAWKAEAVAKLGFGDLNKVVLQVGVGGVGAGWAASWQRWSGGREVGACVDVAVHVGEMRERLRASARPAQVAEE